MNNKRGQSVLEYTLVFAGIAVASLAVFEFIASTTHTPTGSAEARIQRFFRNTTTQLTDEIKRSVSYDGSELEP